MQRTGITNCNHARMNTNRRVLGVPLLYQQPVSACNIPALREDLELMLLLLPRPPELPENPHPVPLHRLHGGGITRKPWNCYQNPLKQCHPNAEPTRSAIPPKRDRPDP